ncbi:putative hydrophobic protein (TIGR00271 family) [Microbacterium endophyticum]|uniref:Putative hydrophobic protein (TIGR00271 family) n=1 Tax=Microbacterium endophyticum TaxID=1526412 RepID=A0A7W4YL94_9MICO|nr:TIGR00341 family protein [Microbacterium endophyticum]MBB2974933.1 putative hydrophobic protein (TIGR00271 family) [Microbacterium endophyticum]NIK37230.1 putative hydrophobic protein (TIGR00271 family) [Microbacterium endophyticum]
MSSLSQFLLPDSQRQSVDDVRDALDLTRGDAVGKRSGFLIMLILSGVIAVAGVLADSTATVIGAMIVAPLGTPILGIGLALVVGRRSLLVRSILWVLASVVIVVFIGYGLSIILPHGSSLSTNSQITGRTSPQLVDLLAAMATGTAGAFAMCRRDLSAILPGVAIAISLVPPLGVVGVCAGQGDWDSALGALILFLSNVISLVIAGSIVFTLAGYSRAAGSSRTANRKRAYAVVAVLSTVIVVPLALNTTVTVVLTGWTQNIEASATEWLSEVDGARVGGVKWTGLEATVRVATPDGTVPATSLLETELESALPEFVDVVVEVGVEATYRVSSRGAGAAPLK